MKYPAAGSLSDKCHPDPSISKTDVSGSVVDNAYQEYGILIQKQVRDRMTKVSHSELATDEG